MAKFSFNHIALSVKDVAESVAFYQQIFQFEEIPNTASSSKTRWLSIGEAKQLHLIPRPDEEIKINKAVHFAFTTDDFDNFVLFLKNNDIPYSDWKDNPGEIYTRDDGIRQVYFQDPSGYWVEVNDDL